MARKDTNGYISGIFVTGQPKSGTTTFATILDELLYNRRSGGKMSRVTIKSIFDWATAQRNKLGNRIREWQMQNAAKKRYPEDLVVEAFDAWLANERSRAERLQLELETFMVGSGPISLRELQMLSRFGSALVVYIEWDDQRQAARGHGGELEKDIQKAFSRLRHGGMLLILSRKDPLVERLKMTLKHFLEQPLPPVHETIIQQGLKRLGTPQDRIHDLIRRIEAAPALALAQG